MSRNYVLNTGNGVTLFVGSNQNVGFHTARPSEKLAFDEGNAKFSSNVYIMKRVGVNMSNPEVEMDITGDAHVTGDIMVDGAMRINNPISVNGFYVTRNSNYTMKTSLSAAVQNMDINTGGTVFAINNTSQEFRFIATSNNIPLMRIPGNGPTILYSSLNVVGDIIPASNSVYNLGSSNLRFKDLYLSGNTINMGGINLGTEASSGSFTVKDESTGTPSPIIVKELVIQDQGQTFKLKNTGGQVKLVSVSNNVEAADAASTIPNLYSYNCNVGIGVVQPSVRFQVSDDAIISSARIGNYPSDKSLAVFAHSNVVLSSSYAVMQSSTSDTYINTGLSRAIRFRVNNNDVATFSSTGRLGVGTTTPSESLDVSTGNAKFGSNMYVLSRLIVGASNNASCTVHIQATDALGIPAGTSAQRPITPVAGQIRYNNSLNTFEGYGPGNTWGSLGGLVDANKDTYISAELYPTSNDDTLRFVTSNIEAMRLTSNMLDMKGTGSFIRLGVGTSNPTEALDILGNLKTSSNVYVLNSLGVGTSSPSTTLEVNGGAKINSNLEVMGSLTIRGITTTIDATTVNILDNIIRINNGAVYNSSMQAGLEINRGTGYSNYMLVFDETSQYFKTGQQGTLQTVATRDDSPEANALMVYDSTGKKLTACNTLVFNNGNLYVGTSSGNARLQVQCANTAEQIVARFTNGTADTLIRPGMRFATSGTQWSTFDASSSGGTGFWKPVAMSSGLAIGTDTTYGQTAPPTRGAIIEGNVGIATTNPTERLHVASGKIWAASGQILGYTGDTAVVPGFSWGDDSNTGMYHPAADTIAFTNNGSETVRVASTGNVGLGTSNPTERLHVASGKVWAAAGQIMAYTGDTAVIPGFSWGDDSNTGIYHPVADTIAFTNNGSETTRITAIGNVGIGTINPSERLHVVGGKILASTNQILGYTGDTALVPAYSWGDDSNTGMYHPVADTIAFTNNGSETVRVASTGNVGLGTTNPTERLHIASGKILAAAGQIMAYTGDTAVVPGFSWGDDSNTGIYHPAADTIAFTNNGSETVRVASTGNVGLGTTNPTERLHVAAGKILSSAGQIMAYTGDTAVVPGFSWGDDSNTGMYHPAADTIAFTNNGSETVRVASTGNVGLGTTNPTERLHIASGKIWAAAGQILGYTGDTALVPAYSWGDDSNTGVYHPAADTIAFTNNGSETMRIDSSGNVGIGKTNPGVRLDVNGTLNATILQQSGNTLTSILSSYASTSSVNGKLDTSGGNISGSLNVSGNLGIGTTSPSFKFDVQGTSAVYASTVATSVLTNGSELKFRSDGNAHWSLFNTNGVGLQINNTTTNAALGTTGTNVITVTTGNQVGIGLTNPSYKLHVSGDVYATNDVIAFSDKRFKDDVQPIPDPLSVIKAMQGCFYKRRGESSRSVGFLAQDLQEVLPEVVRYDASNDVYGVNYANITALLCEGIKALQEQVDQLKACVKN